MNSKFQTILKSVAAGLAVAFLLSHVSYAAGQQTRQQRKSSKPTTSAEPNALVRPTRPADQSAEIEQSIPAIGTEIFIERFPSGKVKVEREVTLDLEGNYVNHGPWRMWNKAGKLMADGTYNMGQRTGIWTRWYDRGESQALSNAPFRGFQAPFLSQATFDSDTMDGEWIIFDSKQRKCLQISIAQGKRHGVTISWMPNGKTLHQSMYINGVPEGEVLALNSKTGELEKSKSFLDGKELVVKKSTHRRSNQPKIVSNYLAPTSVQKDADSFWNLQFAKYVPEGKELRHGRWQEWHKNGQPLVSGHYDHDKKVGKFTYWHANGHKAAEGEFSDDKHNGTWVWWHENGQKSVVGDFSGDLLIGQWRWWAVDGKLAKQVAQNGRKTIESVVDSEIDFDRNAQSTQKVNR